MENFEKNIFKNIWIQPAAGDARALGSILAFWYNEKNHKRIGSSNDKMKGSLDQNFRENNRRKIN